MREEIFDSGKLLVKKDTSLSLPRLWMNPAPYRYCGLEVVPTILQGADEGFAEAKKVANILNDEVNTEINRTASPPAEERACKI